MRRPGRPETTDVVWAGSWSSWASSPRAREQRQAGLLMGLAAHEGTSQQALAELMGLNATRMVFLVDELEQRGLVERRRNPADRRSHALYLTDRGRDTLRQTQQVVAAHE